MRVRGTTLDGVAYVLTVDTDPDTDYARPGNRIGGTHAIGRWLAGMIGQPVPVGPPPAADVVVDYADPDSILAALRAHTRVAAVETDDGEPWSPAESARPVEDAVY